MGLALTDLAEGISWWHQKTKWPRDFHNEVYHNLYDLKKNGLSDSWWDRTVDRLQEWHATRPLTMHEIKKRGFEVLPRLQEMYLDLCAKSQDEPLFLDFRWEHIMGFYSLMADIKGVASPVFPSKLGHFIFPKLLIVMDNKATGVNDYQVFWQSMHGAWSSFSEKTKAKEILLEEINKYSTRKVHERYPFEIKIIELCTIGKQKNPTDHHKSDSDTFTYSEENSKVQRRGVVMERLDEKFSCEHCRFSVAELKEMAEKGGKKEMFTTFGSRNWMNMYEVNTSGNFIIMRRSTGEFTRELSISALIHVHNLVHSGEIDLDPHEIDDLRINGKKETYQWGNYIAALLRHMRCRKILAE